MQRSIHAGRAQYQPPMSSVHLDAIRGAAALIVLLGHTRGLFFASLAGNATGGDQHMLIGDGAVMVFFVLSGYLVGGSVLQSVCNGTWSWKTYLVKRITRLWIVLLPALAIGVALDTLGMHLFSSAASIYSGPPGQQEVHDVASRLTASTISGNAVFLQTIAFQTAGTNNALWSLANEFWYYLAFPVALLALRKNQTIWKRGLFALGFIAILLIAGRSIDLLFPIWLLGAAVSLLPTRSRLHLSRTLASTLMIGLPIVWIAVRRSQLPKYTAESIVALYFATALVFLVKQTQLSHGQLYPAIAGFLSRISYTLYLVHLPMAVFLCALINTPWHRWSMSSRHLLLYASMNTFLVLASYGIYLLFESKTDTVRDLLLSRTEPRSSTVSG